MNLRNNYSFFNITKNLYVRSSSVIGIFDLDTATMSKNTRNFLRTAQDNNDLITISGDIPKSFVVTDSKIYLVQFSSSSLAGRS
ncbi:MAG: DUF370 domain-containing protein [Clostridia bacterium]|nr:DUF370 domain-containing protein [Clostridia bacterium]